MRLSRRLLFPVVLALGTAVALLIPQSASADERTLFGVRGKRQLASTWETFRK